MNATNTEVYDAVYRRCNEILVSKVGIFWDDLPDTVSIWDWIDGSESDKQMDRMALDLCWEKLADEFPFSKDRCYLNNLMYGSCSCVACEVDSIRKEVENDE